MIMKVRDLLRRVDQVAPFSLAMEWDNVGLMAGDLEAEVRRVGVALDPTLEAVTASANQGCQVLLCHHPLLFHPVRKLDLNSDPGRAIREAVRRDVTILAAHTNWDCAPGGVNGALGQLLGLQDCSPLDPETGLGVKGVLPGALSLNETLERLKGAWNLTRLDAYIPQNDNRCSILRVALCGGSGAEFWPAARAWGADLYVTADMKYHELIDATRAGLAVAVADHGEMEMASLPELARQLAACEGAEGDLEVVLLDVRALNAPMRI